MANLAKTGVKRRGRISSIDELPDVVRDFIDDALISRRLTQLKIVDEANKMLVNLGLNNVTGSAIHRRSVKVIESIREFESRELSIRTISKEIKGFDSEEAVNTSLKMLSALIADKVSDLSLLELVDAKDILQLTLAMQRLQAGLTINEKRKKAIRDSALAEAAKKVDDSSVALGISREGARQLKEQILGISIKEH